MNCNEQPWSCILSSLSLCFYRIDLYNSIVNFDKYYQIVSNRRHQFINTCREFESYHFPVPSPTVGILNFKNFGQYDS